MSPDAMKLEYLRRTYCNPLPFQDYPRGICCRAPSVYDDWSIWRKRDFREAADPTVLYHDGKWYLYASAGMAYVSEDFVTWRYHPIDSIMGYAPTIVAFRGKFYLTGSHTPLYVSDLPLGPFTVAGEVVLPPDSGDWLDPMYFADGDDLYAYWGWSANAGNLKQGVYGARMDPDAPWRLASKPQRLIGFDPSHVWERRGSNNEDPSRSAVEGAWMLKREGRYYLVYAAPNTQWRTYAMGVYVGDGPLGPFRYQDGNPIIRKTHGLVQGPGHGCISPGPNNTWWVFYTCVVAHIHKYERRCGMDPVGFDAEGNLFVPGATATETPQWAPGVLDHPELGNDTGLLPLSVDKPATASSCLPGREPRFAVDNRLQTFWQAAKDDSEPWLEVDLDGDFLLSAIRIHWMEPGLDYDNGVPPGPVQYRLEVDDGSGEWRTALDRTSNDTDLLIDYQVMEPTPARKVRLTVTGHPKGVRVAVLSFTAFGVARPADK